MTYINILASQAKQVSLLPDRVTITVDGDIFREIATALILCPEVQLSFDLDNMTCCINAERFDSSFETTQSLLLVARYSGNLGRPEYPFASILGMATFMGLDTTPFQNKPFWDAKTYTDFFKIVSLFGELTDRTLTEFADRRKAAIHNIQTGENNV